MSETPQQYTKRIRGYMAGKKPMEVLSATPRQISQLLNGVSKKRLAPPPSPGCLVGDRDSRSSRGHGDRAESPPSIDIGLKQDSDTGFRSVDVWAKFSNYSTHDPALSFMAYRVNRERNLRLLKGLPRPLWSRYGIHSERGKETVARVTEMMAGHDINHLSQIRRLMKP